MREDTLTVSSISIRSCVDNMENLGSYNTTANSNQLTRIACLGEDRPVVINILHSDIINSGAPQRRLTLILGSDLQTKSRSFFTVNCLGNFQLPGIPVYFERITGITRNNIVNHLGIYTDIGISGIKPRDKSIYQGIL